MLRPILETWESGRLFIRCHNVRFGATEFNPGLGLAGRFNPFSDRKGREVPTLYAADSLEGAVSETIFHNVPVRGPDKAIAKFSLQPMVVSTLACDRDLTLVQLYGFGLSRLEVSRAELIETGSYEYWRTAAWARAIHASDDRVDGLIWISRQYDVSRALVLFGDRVARAALKVAAAPQPLYFSPGYAEIQRVAGLAGITIIE